MAIDFRIGTKILKNLQAALAPATAINPYPYVGVVKNNLDPTRCGRVQVFIPELGGNPDDQANWRTVSYASPFMGYTSTEIKSADIPDITNGFGHVTNTYGMWMVPPDVGVEVICVFVAGDPMRGYWIACVNSNLSRYMLPAIGSSRNIDTLNATANTKASYTTGTQAPVVEFNENISANDVNPNFYNIAKPIHEIQYAILKQQGLNADTTRGTITSSSQRETPSHVFGISTPGRPVNDPADDPNYVRNLNAGVITEDYYRVKARKGGHQFVMDDGSVLGTDQLVRLRTASGHQILMHDTEQTIYISHAKGNSWVELTADGSINIYSKTGLNLRSEGDINFHSDKNINLHAGHNITMVANGVLHQESSLTELLQGDLHVDSTGGIYVKSTGTFNLDSVGNVSIHSIDTLILNGNTINSNVGGAVSVTGINSIPLYEYPGPVFDANTGTFYSNVGQTVSSVTVLPTHEPYDRSGNNITVFGGNIYPTETWTLAYDAIDNIPSYEFGNPISLAIARTQPIPTISLWNLTKTQIRVILAQLGAGRTYSGQATVGPGGVPIGSGATMHFGGKYELSPDILKQYGYILSNRTVTQAEDSGNLSGAGVVDQPGRYYVWSGLDGIYSEADFFARGDVQERIMQDVLKSKFTTLVTNGAITRDLTPAELAGIILIGIYSPEIALIWRSGTGAKYNLDLSSYGYTFLTGKDLIVKIAPQLAG